MPDLIPPIPMPTNERLGYPADARLLILNADDFGMYEGINEAIVRAFAQGVLCSTTLMAPCPSAQAALRRLRDHPDLPVGIHLTVICDLTTYRYGPLSPVATVPSLVEADGRFATLDLMDAFLARARLDELEREFRAQIETVLAAGVAPTHLDWHCLHSGGRADIFDLTLGLARDYGLAVRVAQRPLSAQMQRQGYVTVDYDLLDSFRIETAHKPARYHQLLRELPHGLSEWAVHPGIASPQSQSFDDGWPVRQADVDFLMDDETRDIIRQEGIILLSYQPLQQAWLDRASWR